MKQQNNTTYYLSITTVFYLYSEEWVRRRFAIAINGLGQLEKRVFDVQAEGFLQHAVHLVDEFGPLLLHLF